MEQKRVNWILKKASEGADKYPIEDILSRFGAGALSAISRSLITARLL